MKGFPFSPSNTFYAFAFILTAHSPTFLRHTNTMQFSLLAAFTAVLGAVSVMGCKYSSMHSPPHLRLG